MFGTDYPSLPLDRLLREWDELGYRDEIMHKMFHANTERVLGLPPGAAPAGGHAGGSGVSGSGASKGGAGQANPGEGSDGGRDRAPAAGGKARAAEERP